MPRIEGGCRDADEPRSSATVSLPLLIGLLLPPLLVCALVPADQRGPAVARLLVPGFALGTLDRGVGDLALGALRAHATGSPEGALFVSLSVGVMLGGAAPWPPRHWKSWTAALPPGLVALGAIWPGLRVGPLLLGAVLGAIPVLLGAALPATPRLASAAAATASSRLTGWLLLGLAMVLALAGPLMLVVLTPLAALGVAAARRGDLPGGLRQAALPAVATVAALGLGWLGLTIAGEALAEVASFFRTAPVSPAAERWLALFAVITVVAMLAPWPLQRWGPGLGLAPAAAVLAHRFLLGIAPAAIGDWQPVLGLALVPSAVVAALVGRWPLALATVAVLAALGSGPLSAVAAAVAMVAAVALVAMAGERNPLASGRVTFAGAWWAAVLTAAGAAAATVAVLAHEVVLATLLACGLACAAARVRAAPAAPFDSPT